ncbi:MAG: DUF4258 domain-containing protein [Candidatus Omnitrophica bacterium]|nr:DUF4258 domain-containing protein [Candidatus Omnitrophota bacterium]
MSIILSIHTRDMLVERNISEEWVWRTINNPDRENLGRDNNNHYFKSISEYGGRILHVVVNSHVSPKKIVTVFFDRRQGGAK